MSADDISMEDYVEGKQDGAEKQLSNTIDDREQSRPILPVRHTQFYQKGRTQVQDSVIQNVK